jgi:glycosyltransferase involved in cell wall biosynthesis
MEISVVIPLYNKKETIIRALESVLNQTYGAREIIVVNDGSSDGCDELVRSMNIENLRLVDQINAGVSAARNRGFRSANCEWVAFLDGDDEWEVDFLRSVEGMHQRYPGHEVYATAYFAGDYLGARRRIQLNRVPFSDDEGVLENYFEVASCSDPPLWSSAICIRKEALYQIGGFPLDIKSGEDLLTWARLAVRTPPVYCTRPLAVFWQEKAHTYHDRPNRVPEPDDPVGNKLAELKKVSGGLVRDIDRYLSMWHKMRSSIYLRLGFPGRAFPEILKALWYQPTSVRLYVYLLLCVMPPSVTGKAFKKFGQ